jgi:hypothetical protein
LKVDLMLSAELAQAVGAGDPGTATLDEPEPQPVTMRWLEN